MLVLAIDTSGKIGSACLYDDKIGVIGEINLYVKLNHSAIIMSIIDSLMKLCKVDIKDVNKIGIVTGPGSFTGVRIGTAIAKGLCYDNDKIIVGVNELDVLAHNSENVDGLIVSMIDARKERVYYSTYRWENHSLIRTSEYLDGEIRDILSNIDDSTITFVGDGAIAYSDIIKEECKDKNIWINSKANSFPKSSIVAQLASNMTGDNLFTLEPVYISKSQAEREKNNKNR